MTTRCPRKRESRNKSASRRRPTRNIADNDVRTPELHAFDGCIFLPWLSLRIMIMSVLLSGTHGGRPTDSPTRVVVTAGWGGSRARRAEFPARDGRKTRVVASPVSHTSSPDVAPLGWNGDWSPITPHFLPADELPATDTLALFRFSSLYSAFPPVLFLSFPHSLFGFPHRSYRYCPSLSLFLFLSD